jgi:hypothetical protein
MNSSQAVRNLVRELLHETYTAHAPVHLRVRGFRRPGFREASQDHLDLQRGGGGTNGGADAKSSRMLARQHASIADGHAQAFSRSGYNQRA